MYPAREGWVACRAAAAGLWLLLLLCLAPAAGSVAAPHETVHREAAPRHGAEAGAQAGASVTRTLSLRELGAQKPIELRGVDRSVSLPLPVRFDEAVVRARLHLEFTFSPSLLPELSQLRVLIDDQPLASLRLPRERMGTPQRVDVELDPRYFVDYAHLRLQFIGHYTSDCEYPLHTSLWASVSNASTLEITTRPLQQRNDLALLPVPFFDVRDNRPLELAVVLPARPSPALVRGAGVIASWFGSLSGWRGAHFPALTNVLPDQHALVLATNDERPAVPGLPRVEHPTLAVADSPGHPGRKLLLVLGRDAEQLRQAVEALVLSHGQLSGERAEVTGVRLPRPSEPYHAPNWVPTGERVRFGQLVPAAGNLQSTGNSLDPIGLNLRLPADVFTWESRGMPVDLRFRYTPPLESGQAMLSVRVNGELVQAMPLRGGTDAATSERLELPFLQDTGTLHNQAFTVPAFALGPVNQLDFQFDIPPRDEGRCRASGAWVQAAIDPDSTLDLRHIEHYTAMPNLAHFANSGFPFTVYADLAQTGVVLAAAPGPAQVQAYLTALGAIGAASGAPATRFALVTPEHVADLADRDLLVIASGPRDPLLTQWNSTLPVRIESGHRSAPALVRMADAGSEWFTGALARHYPRDGWAEVSAQGAIGAVMAMESPLASGHSVVVLAGSDDASLVAAAQALTDPARVRDFQGDLTLLRGAAVESYRVGDTYYVGHLAWWRWIWFQLHAHPLVLVALGLALGIALALLVYGALRRVAARRLVGES
jgi:hypothetical protein